MEDDAPVVMQARPRHFPIGGRLVELLITMGAESSMSDPNGLVPGREHMLAVAAKGDPDAEDLSIYHYGTAERSDEWQEDDYAYGPLKWVIPSQSNKGDGELTFPCISPQEAVFKAQNSSSLSTRGTWDFISCVLDRKARGVNLLLLTSSNHVQVNSILSGTRRFDKSPERTSCIRRSGRRALAQDRVE